MVDIVHNRRLFIIGAGDLGREIESWLNLVPVSQRDWELIGFLDKMKKGNPLEQYPSEFEILGDWETFEYQSGDCCIIGIADVHTRERVYKTLSKVATFLSFVAPSAIVGKYTTVPVGTVISPNCIISTNVKLGIGCFFNSGTQIGHDVKIGQFSSLMAGIDIGGDCVIGEKVFIGSGAVILPRRKIGDNARIGAGSVVLRNVKEGTTVFGNPAREI